ncbi:MAG: YtxH domain-containing protein [bacterium]|nr:YtxH domain-containing protein [bacterium]
MTRLIKTMGLTIGSMMTGVVLGMMIAPKRGKDLRKDVSNAMCTMKDMVMNNNCCDNCEHCNEE